MIYTTGTIAISGSTLTGTGTNFTASGSLIRVGCTVIAMSNPVQVFQITAVGSATSLSVTPAASPALAAGTKFAILLSDSLSVDGLAQDIAETFTLYQKNISGFADVMNGSADVTITINGVAVKVPGQQSLAKKGANKDITSLSGLTTALSVAQGGTGGKTAAEARANLGLGDAATKVVGTAAGNVMAVGAFGLGRTSSPGEIVNFSTRTWAQGESTYIKPDSTNWPVGVPHTHLRVTALAGRDSGSEYSLLMFQDGAGSDLYYATSRAGSFIGRKVLTNGNTTTDSSGFIKTASPIVQLFHDGRCVLNGESEGCTVTRLSTGEYLIEGCMGLNTDAAWGGIDGGFDIPKDRNGQPLIWLDYEVNADGSVLVKTYHRTYPDAPPFARHDIAGLANGEPVDIPADQFVSVRVEMPIDSIWNQKVATTELDTIEEGGLLSD